MYAVAVQSPELRNRYAAGAARAREPYTVCDLDATPHTKLTTLDLGELDLVSVALQGRRETVLGEAEAVVMQGGRLEGFAVYFELRDGDARLTTAPALYAGSTPRAASWTQALFHVDAAPVVEAKELMKAGAGRKVGVGSADPYVRCDVDGISKRTTVIKKSQNPRWETLLHLSLIHI